MALIDAAQKRAIISAVKKGAPLASAAAQVGIRLAFLIAELDRDPGFRAAIKGPAAPAGEAPTLELWHIGANPPAPLEGDDYAHVVNFRIGAQSWAIETPEADESAIEPRDQVAAPVLDFLRGLIRRHKPTRAIIHRGPESSRMVCRALAMACASEDMSPEFVPSSQIIAASPLVASLQTY